LIFKISAEVLGGRGEQKFSDRSQAGCEATTASGLIESDAAALRSGGTGGRYQNRNTVERRNALMFLSSKHFDGWLRIQA
jgi:hypothetical protein